MSKDISKDTENPFETTSRKYGLLPESIAGTVESGYRRPLRFSQRPANRWFVHVYHDRSKNGEGKQKRQRKNVARVPNVSCRETRGLKLWKKNERSIAFDPYLSSTRLFKR